MCELPPSFWWWALPHSVASLALCISLMRKGRKAMPSVESLVVPAGGVLVLRYARNLGPEQRESVRKATQHWKDRGINVIVAERPDVSISVSGAAR